MKKYLLILTLFLTGCQTVPVKQTFPELPESLKMQCPDLNQAAENTTDITELLRVVVSNYQLYYACKNKNLGWAEWYEKQKKIFDKANK
jgi:hypothetical protein